MKNTIPIHIAPINERTMAWSIKHRPLSHDTNAWKQGYNTVYDLLMGMNPPRNLVNELRQRKDLPEEIKAWLERIEAITR